TAVRALCGQDRLLRTPERVMRGVYPGKEVCDAVGAVKRTGIPAALPEAVVALNGLKVARRQLQRIAESRIVVLMETAHKVGHHFGMDPHATDPKVRPAGLVGLRLPERVKDPRRERA